MCWQWGHMDRQVPLKASHVPYIEDVFNAMESSKTSATRHVPCIKDVSNAMEVIKIVKMGGEAVPISKDAYINSAVIRCSRRQPLPQEESSRWQSKSLPERVGQ